MINNEYDCFQLTHGVSVSYMEWMPFVHAFQHLSFDKLGFDIMGDSTNRLSTCWVIRQFGFRHFGMDKLGFDIMAFDIWLLRQLDIGWITHLMNSKNIFFRKMRCLLLTVIFFVTISLEYDLTAVKERFCAKMKNHWAYERLNLKHTCLDMVRVMESKLCVDVIKIVQFFE